MTYLKVGGQAVIEGVLMMGKKVVVAVRQANGDIAVKELGGVSQNNKWMKIPFIRGFFSLFYSLSFGLKAIDLSAELSSGEEMKKSARQLFESSSQRFDEHEFVKFVPAH